jgi:hypothetical protein
MYLGQNVNEARHMNDHSEEEMLQIVAVTDDRESLERLLAAERERICVFKPRAVIIEAVLAKLSKCAQPEYDSQHLNKMRRLYESYGSSDPGHAEKVKAAEAQSLEMHKKTFAAIQERDERLFKMRQSLKGK